MARRNRRKMPAEQRRAHRRRRLGGMLRGLVRLLGLTVLGMGLGTGAYLLYDFLNSSPALSLRRIEISGLVHTTAEQVRRVAGLEEGMNIFSVEPADCARQIESLPWIKDAVVQRLVPDRVVVEVREYQPVAVLAAGELYLVEAGGRVFKRAHWWEDLDLPVLTGINPDWLQKRQQDVVAMIGQGLRLLSGLGKLPCLRARRIAQIHLDELLGPSIVIDPGPLVVSMGPAAAAQPELLCRALTQLQRRRLRAQALLVSRSQQGWQATISGAGRGEANL